MSGSHPVAAVRPVRTGCRSSQTAMDPKCGPYRRRFACKQQSDCATAISKYKSKLLASLKVRESQL